MVGPSLASTTSTAAAKIGVTTAPPLPAIGDEVAVSQPEPVSSKNRKKRKGKEEETSDERAERKRRKKGKKEKRESKSSQRKHSRRLKDEP